MPKQPRDILASHVASIPVDAEDPPTLGGATFRGSSPGGCGSGEAALSPSLGSAKGAYPCLLPSQSAAEADPGGDFFPLISAAMRRGQQPRSSSSLA